MTVYIIKDHNGEITNHRVDKVITNCDKGVCTTEIYLKDPFDIATANVTEIMDRLQDCTETYITHYYDGGILHLEGWQNIGKLIHDLNIPYYKPPVNHNIIEGHFLKNSTGTYLNLRSLKKAIIKAREKGELKK